MLSKYKFFTESKFQSFARKLHWINPNVITIIGIIPQFLFLIFMQSGRNELALLMLLFSPIDMLDGLIARANNTASAFGGFLDSSVDRVGDFLIIAGLYAGGLLPLSAAATLLLITFLISYVRSRAELASNSTIKFDYGIIERPERIIYIFFAVLLHILLPTTFILGYALPTVMLFLLIALSVYTLGQRIFYAYTNLTAMDAININKINRTILK